MAEKGNRGGRSHRVDCCSFCGRKRSEADILFQGLEPGVNICGQCIEMGYNTLSDNNLIASKQGKAQPQQKGFSNDLSQVPKPMDIKRHLDEYVIGQDSAKRAIAVAVYNHYKRLAAKEQVADVEIDKSNILLVGPTGTGKTLIARTIAQLLNVPFTIVDATVLTEAGYVGEDVESILSRLLQVADYNVEAAERRQSAALLPQFLRW